MNKPAHGPAILQGTRRVRYLRLIAIFKITKGVLLLVLGVSLLFLNARTGWLDGLSNWIADEILLKHSKPYRLFAPQTTGGNRRRHFASHGASGAVLCGDPFN